LSTVPGRQRPSACSAFFMRAVAFSTAWRAEMAFSMSTSFLRRLARFPADVGASADASSPAIAVVEKPKIR